MSFIYYFVSSEWLGDVATSLLFPPLFIFGNEKQPEALKKNLYSLSQIQEDTKRYCCLAMPTYRPWQPSNRIPKRHKSAPEPYEEKLN